MTEAYTPYALREGWSDLVPIKQDDAPNALVPIAYTEECESRRRLTMTARGKADWVETAGGRS